MKGFFSPLLAFLLGEQVSLFGPSPALPSFTYRKQVKPLGTAQVCADMKLSGEFCLLNKFTKRVEMAGVQRKKIYVFLKNWIPEKRFRLGPCFQANPPSCLSHH